MKNKKSMLFIFVSALLIMFITFLIVPKIRVSLLNQSYTAISNLETIEGFFSKKIDNTKVFEVYYKPDDASVWVYAARKQLDGDTLSTYVYTTEWIQFDSQGNRLSTTQEEIDPLNLPIPGLVKIEPLNPSNKIEANNELKVHAFVKQKFNWGFFDPFDGMMSTTGGSETHRWFGTVYFDVMSGSEHPLRLSAKAQLFSKYSTYYTLYNDYARRSYTYSLSIYQIPGANASPFFILATDTNATVPAAMNPSFQFLIPKIEVTVL